jgi:hypothetical protein
VEAFYILGSVLAAWALLVTFLGVTRKSFPASAGAERLVALVSAGLVIAAVGAAVIGSANEKEKEHEESGGGHDEAAWTLPV